MAGANSRFKVDNGLVASGNAIFYDRVDVEGNAHFDNDVFVVSGNLTVNGSIIYANVVIGNGGVIPISDQQPLGNTSNRFNAFLYDTTSYGTLKPNANGGALGTTTERFQVFANNITVTNTVNFPSGAAVNATNYTGTASNANTVGNVSANGFYVRTGDGTAAARSITSANGITTTNGNGVNGNVTLTFNAGTGLFTNSTGAHVNASAISTGTLPITRGGTGQTTKAAALDALLPTQSLSTNTYVLQSNGSGGGTQWAQLVGPTGPQGDIGPVGPSGTLSVGTVTTGAAGSNVSITNSGNSTVAVFNFTIPRGDTGNTGSQGATGPQGPAGTISLGPVTTGPAGSSASVTNSGNSTVATLNFTIPQGATGPTPSITTAATTLTAGANATATITGPAATPTITFGIPAGPPGAASTVPGPPGPAGTITGATATTGPIGVSLGGTSTARTFAFSIPAGADGPPGAPGAPGETGTTPSITATAATGPIGVTVSGPATSRTFAFSIPQGAAGPPGSPASAAAPILRHETAAYQNGGKVFVTASTPSASAAGDIWLDTSGTSGYSGSLSSTGWTALPNGLKFNWGIVYQPAVSGNHGIGSTAVTFSSAFTTACYNVQLTPTSFEASASADEADEHFAATSLSTTGFTLSVQGDAGPASYYYFAIGK